MTDLYTDAGKRIRKIREIKGLTRAVLSEEANISVRFLQQIETNQKGFSARVLWDIAKVLGVSGDYIMCGKENEVYQEVICQMLSEYGLEQLQYVYEILKNVNELRNS